MLPPRSLPCGRLTGHLAPAIPCRALSRRLDLLAALWVLLSGIGAPRVARAAGSDFQEAMRVRRLVILDPSRAYPEEGEVLVLPVSRGFDQRSTSLCWVYATLNGLESALRVRQPLTEVELNRRAMQILTIEDRYLRKIRQTATYIGERGVAVDAMRLLSGGGLVAFGDFTDVDDPYGDFDIDSAVESATGEAAKILALRGGLDQVYGVTPSVTHLDGREVTRKELAMAIVSGQVWESFAIATSGPEGYRPHPDPDARPGAVSWFMSEGKLVARIRSALRSGNPVEITIGGHCVLIYGAAYNQAGNPIRYYVKDSYPDYFYKADPARLMRNLVEVTTARN